MPQQRRRALPSSLLLAVLVALVALTTLQAVSAADLCAVTTCNNSGVTCTRSSGNCPVCLQDASFLFFINYKCTSSSRTGDCPNGYTKCPAPTPAPSPTPSPTVKPTSAPTPTPSPTTKPTTTKPSASPTAATPTPGSTPKSASTSTSSSSSSSNSPLAEAKPANTNSSSAATANEARSESSQLKPASVDTPIPEIAVTTTSDSGSSSSIWIIIVACAVVACVVAAVVGAWYAIRRKREERDDSEIDILGKDLDVFPATQRQTETTEFSDSALDLNATPSTSKFAYVPAGQATGAMNRNSAAIGAADTGMYLKTDTVWRQTTSHHSFRGSQHINMSYIMDDDPLTASQLSTSVPQPARESRDVFPAPESPVSSEWATSGYFDPDGGHNSANTEFYSSKISAISADDDDRQFTHRSSESLANKDSAKWKQKFYVEL